MDPAAFSASPGLRRPRRLVPGVWVAVLLLPVGCAQLAPTAGVPLVVRAASAAPKELPPANDKAVAAPAAPTVPINLDTVLQLARDQNGHVAVAREQVNEALVKQDIAARSWLPDLWVGLSWYRHEGGIAFQDGSLIHSSFSSLFGGIELGGTFDLRNAIFLKVQAERQVWQQKGELTKLTSDALLDASTTYVDLLAARTAELIAQSQE